MNAVGKQSGTARFDQDMGNAQGRTDNEDQVEGHAPFDLAQGGKTHGEKKQQQEDQPFDKRDHVKSTQGDDSDKTADDQQALFRREFFVRIECRDKIEVFVQVIPFIKIVTYSEYEAISHFQFGQADLAR